MTAVENMGAQMVKEVATKTSDVAGDGTTTATVLAQAIFGEGLKNVTAGTNPMGIRRGIEQGRRRGGSWTRSPGPVRPRRKGKREISRRSVPSPPTTTTRSAS